MNSARLRRNPWFEGRRPLMVRILIKDFFRTYADFLALYTRYSGGGQVAFADIDRLVGSENRKGHLWRLKDSCHRLWREVSPQEEPNGCLFDWVMGSLFHEAMKLKENAYIHQYYWPSAEEMAQRQGGGLTIGGMDCRRFMEGTAREITSQVENLGLMFGRANYLLRLTMTEQAGNVILLRYLIENEEVVVQLWSESVRDLFQEIFAGAPEEGYRLAAESYWEDHWHQQALASFLQALEINPQRSELRRRVWQLQAILRDQQAAP